MLVNLLSNALKFTSDGSVTMRVVNDSNRRITFAVQDTGIGIKQEDKPKLFKLFGMLDDP